MTIKGKRAAALRKITHDEAGKFARGRGGFVDESFPIDAVRRALRGLGVDLDEFGVFFGPRIGRYRATLESNDPDDENYRPSVAAELDFMEETLEAIEQVRLRLGNLPPMVGLEANVICWKARHEWFSDLTQRIDQDLSVARNVLIGAGRAVEPHKNKAGTKARTGRDWLLHDVAHWLSDRGIGTTKAADVAGAILRSVGIDVQDDPGKARAIVRAWERRTAAANSA